MSELGNLLKKTREEQGKTLAAVKNDTRIQEAFLVAIELGNYSALPSYLHSYGFVKKYAEYLGFDYADIKATFDKECPKNHDAVSAEQTKEKDNDNEAIVRELIVKTPIKAAEKKEEKNIPYHDKFSDSNRIDTLKPIKIDDGKSFPVIPVVIGIIIVVALVVFFVKSSKNGEIVALVPAIDNKTASIVADDFSPDDNASTDNITVFVEGGNPGEYDATTDDNMTAIDDAIPDVDATISDNQTLKQDNATLAVIPAKQETVVMSFSEECWISFAADNGTSQEYLSPAGSTLRLKFEKFFTIDIGNAAAAIIKYNAQTFAGFGRPGIVRKLKYSLDNGTLVRVNE